MYVGHFFPQPHDEYQWFPPFFVDEGDAIIFLSCALTYLAAAVRHLTGSMWAGVAFLPLAHPQELCKHDASAFLHSPHFPL